MENKTDNVQNNDIPKEESKEEGVIQEPPAEAQNIQPQTNVDQQNQPENQQP